jgi:hypothetical protein
VGPAVSERRGSAGARERGRCWAGLGWLMGRSVVGERERADRLGRAGRRERRNRPGSVFDFVFLFQINE